MYGICTCMNCWSLWYSCVGTCTKETLILWWEKGQYLPFKKKYRGSNLWYIYLLHLVDFYGSTVGRYTICPWILWDIRQLPPSLFSSDLAFLEKWQQQFPCVATLGKESRFMTWTSNQPRLPSGKLNIAVLNMDPDWRCISYIENGDIPASYLSLLEGTSKNFRCSWGYAEHVQMLSDNRLFDSTLHGAIVRY